MPTLCTRDFRKGPFGSHEALPINTRGPVELTALGGDGEPLRLVGLGVPFDVRTAFRCHTPPENPNTPGIKPEPQYEIIRRGAFDITTKAHPIYLMWNHDRSRVFASTIKGDGQPGNLRLWEDEAGIWFEATLLDTEEDRTAWMRIRSGIVPRNSYGFEDFERDTIIDYTEDPRGIGTSVVTRGDLHEISVGVAFPANPFTTHTEARTMPQAPSQTPAKGSSSSETQRQAQAGAGAPTASRAFDPEQQAEIDAIKGGLSQILQIVSADQTSDMTEESPPPAPTEGEAQRMSAPNVITRSANSGNAPQGSFEAQSAELKNLRATIDELVKGVGDAKAMSQRGMIGRLFAGNPETDTNNRDRSFGDWALAVRRNDRSYIERKYQTRTAMTGTSGALGGFLVPTEYLPTLYQIAGEQGIARSRSTIVPMNSRTMQVPYLNHFSTPTAGDSAFNGGVVARWTAEAATLNETEPDFKQLELTAHELSGYSKASNSVIEDSAVGIEQVLIGLFGKAIMFHEDYAFLRADGVGKPLGIGSANNAAALSVSRNTATTFKFVDAVAMLGKFLPGYGYEKSAWILQQGLIGQLLTMVDAGNNNITLTPTVMGGGATQKPLFQLLGLPVIFTEKLPALGTARDALLVNFEHYLIGDRKQVEIGYSEHASFTTNQSTWRFVTRVDGQPWMKSAVTLSDASTTVSPYVYLS